MGKRGRVGARVSNPVGSELDVGEEDDGVALEGLVVGEVGEVGAGVDSGLVGAEVEAVAEFEEDVGAGHVAGIRWRVRRIGPSAATMEAEQSNGGKAY